MEGRILDKKFESVKADENNKKWDVISKREQELMMQIQIFAHVLKETIQEYYIQMLIED